MLSKSKAFKNAIGRDLSDQTWQLERVKPKGKDSAMKNGLVAVRTSFALSILSSCSWLALPACAAGSGQTLPPLLEAGFLSWAKGGGVDPILNGWQRGGLMEGGSKAAVQARYFRNLSATLGNYRSR